MVGPNGKQAVEKFRGKRLLSIKNVTNRIESVALQHIWLHMSCIL